MKYKLSDDWEDLLETREIVVYGFGNLAHLYLPQIMKDFHVHYIIDNNPNKKGIHYNEAVVMPFDEIKDIITDKKIVVFAGTNIAENLRQEIKDYLREQGLREYIDFCDIERFVIEWYWRFLREVNIYQIHTALTTKCTLKCRNCNMFIPYYKNHVEYTADDIDRNLKLLFQYSKHIFKYQLVGGEPFLNKDIYNILKLIGEKYGNHISWKRLVTNGTIVPDEKIFQILKKYEYDIVISDYTQQVPYDSKINLLEEKLKQYDISYQRERALTWVDIGIPNTLNEVQHEDVKAHMVNCASSWHGFADEKIFYCNVAWSAEKCGLFKNVSGDYVDLNVSINEGTDVKESLVSLSLGELNNGCNSLCKYCKGCGTDNTDIIPAGEQIVNK